MPPAMNNTYICFGELLWDLLPAGPHPGGAPFNVAVHLSQLRGHASLISAVGRDTLGDDILAIAGQRSVDTRFVARRDNGLPTGTVNVTVDAAGQATYDIVRPVAWDEISVTDAAMAAVAGAGAFVFGSLAARSPHNLAQLKRLLGVAGPMKLFDVNLRPPFADLSTVLTLAERADVVKLNHEEAAKISAVLRGADTLPTASVDPGDVQHACEIIADETGVDCVCVTMAAAGAVMWHHGTFAHRPAPAIVVKDTVGAGDAFMAGLTIGLVHGMPPAIILETAVRLGAYVASQHGATPRLSDPLVDEMTAAI